MKRPYPYLKDPRAIAEIRKHQWIESEKAGTEIGFGTAAIDWVNKFGQQWEIACAKIDKNVLIENRKYRRFSLESFAVLIQETKRIIVRTINISVQGTLCVVKEQLREGSEVVLQWSSVPDGKSGIEFKGKIFRIWNRHINNGEYELLVKFNEKSQKDIENFRYLLNN